MPCFALNASDTYVRQDSLDDLVEIALIVEVIASYVFAVGIWIVVFYLGVGADSHFVVVVVLHCNFRCV